MNPYPDLNAVLRVFVDDVRGALGETFVGAYLQGSFAVGDFDSDSDVDFIVAVRDELTSRQVADLQIVHARTYALQSVWAQHLQGSYFPTALLRDHRSAGTPLWYVDHGSQALIRSNHCNTALVRWVVREQAFIVHSYCRMLHDLIEGRPGSKRAGAEWAKALLDPEWIGLIDRSWGGRTNPAVSVREPPDVADFERTLAFVRYVTAESVRCGF